MIKLCLIGPYPLHGQKIRGGVCAATYYLVQGLKELKEVEIHVVVTTKEIDQDIDFDDDGVAIHCLREPKQRIIPNQLTNIGRIRNVIDRINPDVVHGETPWGTLAGLQSGRPTVHTIHGIVHREIKWERGLWNRANVNLHSYLARKAITGAQHVIIIGPYCIREYAKEIQGRTYLIHNAVEDRFFQLPAHEKDGLLLYAGHINRRKNVMGLVKAFDIVRSHCPTSKLIIAGGAADPGYAKQVYDYIDSHNMGESVILAGLLDQEDLSAAYADASIVCLFSLQETTPVVIAQAMAAGKPVVASSAGGTSDLVVDGETGFLVDAGDEQSFARRIIELLSDSLLRKRMGERGREIANELFRKEIVAKKTLEVYRVARHQVF